MRCRKFTLTEAHKLRKFVRLPKGIPDKEWLYGLNVELEHADVTKCARIPTAKIAAVHFREVKNYYVLLRKHVER